MNYGEVRDKFIELTGRFDLVNEDGTDSGADFFLHKGQRYLDRHHYHQKSIARVFRKIASGDHGVIFDECRAIKEVWIADTEDRIQMEKRSQIWFRENYAKEPYSVIDTGTPYYYTLGLFRTHPAMEAMPGTDLAAIMGYLDVPMSDGHKYNGILFAPPSDGEYMIEVIGHFYSPQMTDYEDKNFWTESHPEVLIKAALYQLEGFYRNSEGLKDAGTFLLGDVIEMDKDVVEEEMADIDLEMGDV